MVMLTIVTNKARVEKIYQGCSGLGAEIIPLLCKLDGECSRLNKDQPSFCAVAISGLVLLAS